MWSYCKGWCVCVHAIVKWSKVMRNHAYQTGWGCRSDRTVFHTHLHRVVKCSSQIVAQTLIQSIYVSADLNQSSRKSILYTNVAVNITAYTCSFSTLKKNTFRNRAELHRTPRGWSFFSFLNQLIKFDYYPVGSNVQLSLKKKVIIVMILFISCHSRSYLKTIYTSTKSRSTILLHDTLRHGRRTKTSKENIGLHGAIVCLFADKEETR